MGQPLRILLVEDSPDDAELLLHELRRGGYEPSFERVACAEAMRAALKKPDWELVISDYVMPGFGGLEALELFKETALDVPFIIVSGHIGEEIAVGAIQAGADDYLMKDRLGRLVAAIERGLSQAEGRRAHAAAAAALRESEERFRQLAENIGAVFFMFEKPNCDSPGSISYVSPAFEKIWGYPGASLFWDPDLWFRAIHPEDKRRLKERLPRMAQGNFHEEFRVVRMDLKIRWVQYRTFPVRNMEGAIYRVAAIAEDITERKKAEEQLAGYARQLQNTVQELRVIEGELRERNDELVQARTELERRVQERTSDLTLANAELQRQMTERRRLENELLEIAENERRRIGFDLHDDIGQKLMGVSLLLKALETNLSHKQMPEAVTTAEVQKLINDVVNHTHNLAHCFSSLDSGETDLCALLKKLVTTVRHTFAIGCRFRAVGQLPEVPAEIAVQLYKIGQESVSNAIKHGKASVVFISLAHQQGQILLRVKNDGVPFPDDWEANRRMGLRIMNYRAKTLGGVLDIRANGNSGTIVTCAIPLVNVYRQGTANPMIGVNGSHKAEPPQQLATVEQA